MREQKSKNTESQRVSQKVKAKKEPKEISGAKAERGRPSCSLIMTE